MLTRVVDKVILPGLVVAPTHPALDRDEHDWIQEKDCQLKWQQTSKRNKASSKLTFHPAQRLPPPRRVYLVCHDDIASL